MFGLLSKVHISVGNNLTWSINTIKEGITKGVSLKGIEEINNWESENLTKDQKCFPAQTNRIVITKGSQPIKNKNTKVKYIVFNDGEG